jgi:hypothetical protein
MRSGDTSQRREKQPGKGGGAYNGNQGNLAMLKAVLRKGAIVPLEPVPPEWEKGAALEVAKTDVAQIAGRRRKIRRR